MKKGFTILAAAVAVLLISGTVLAATLQQGVTYSSGFQVANLSDTEDAQITITYYPQAGTPIEVTDVISAAGSVTYATIHSQAGSPFNGSVVVAADQPIAAIANTLGNFPAYAAATGGFSEGSTSFALPLVMCNNNGFDTWFNVQNAGSSEAHITINYVPGLAGNAAQDTATIQPGRALTFDQKAGSAGSTKKCGAGLGDRFVGGATITSDQPIVATVMQINQAGFNVLMGYNGFTGGAADVRAPLVMANNNGFYTGIQVQNAGTQTTTVTIAFATNTVAGGQPTNLTFPLGPGASATYIQNGNDGTNNWNTVGRYVGAATITSNNGQPLVAIVNQVLAGAISYGTAYEGFDAASATANVNVPLVMANNATYYTGIQVQNVSAVNDCNVTIDFGPNTVATGVPTDLTFALDAGLSATYIQNGNDGTNDWTAIGRYVGSAKVTAATPGCRIVAIVNEFSADFAGDQFYTFDAFNY